MIQMKVGTWGGTTRENLDLLLIPAIYPDRWDE